MKHPLWLQVLGLATLSILLGLANNFRPAAHIDWVRAWTPFSEVSTQEAAVVEPPVKEEEKASTIPSRILENSGITDIGISEAHDIFKYGADLTLWIDARSPELYAEGHVEGAELLNFYDQEATIEQIRALVAERQPEALVIYCKGKDCTDSHHLAEDLQAKEGFSNIFVYKDGFDDWYKAGYPNLRTLPRAHLAKISPKTPSWPQACPRW
jgi:rhodanese-related sulfurtransferase